MIRKVSKFIQLHQLFEQNSKLLVAVSGGVDSVVLLHLLHALHYECVAAHCNFHLRGAESDSDTDFVRQFAQQLGIELFKTDFETEKYAQQHRISIEMAARDLRYRWFEQIRAQEQCHCVVVAHHADDAVETFFLNLARGTGVKGLGGIAPRNGAVVRPLLSCFRSEIEAYAREHDLHFCVDSTNADNAYKRNFVRNEIVPMFKRLNPSFSATMMNNLNLLREANTFISATIQQQTSLVEQTADGCKISISELQKQPSMSLVLHELLSPYGFNQTITETILRQLNEESGKQFFSASHRVIKDRKQLIVSKISSQEETEFLIQENDEHLTAPFEIQITQMTNIIIPTVKNTVALDYAKLHFPLTLRRWKSGDWFVPLGMKGRKKLSDFFTDNKFSLLDKERAWILVDGTGDVIWIVGCRLDDRYKITAATTKMYLLKVG